MSDEMEDGGELSLEAKTFLARHAATGEPSAEALERVRRKLSAPRAEAPLRSTFLRSEVMAAAAVVLLLLGAQGLYLAFRAPSEEVKMDPPRAAAQPEPELLPALVTLAPGNQTELELKASVQRVAVGDTSIADVRAIGNRGLLVIGVGEGSTTLVVWFENGERASTVVKVGRGAR